MSIAATKIAATTAPCDRVCECEGVATTDDAVLVALDGLMEVLEENAARIRIARARADAIRTARRSGLPWKEIVSSEDGPLIVELVSENLDALRREGAALRRAEARALHDEGVTMERIAELFGVTRQRVSALLRESRER